MSIGSVQIRVPLRAPPGVKHFGPPGTALVIIKIGTLASRSIKIAS